MSPRLAVVVAHPDDDAFGVTGSVGLHAGDPDLRFTLVLATSGERGMISDPALATRENLGEVRERECRAGWRAMGREPDRLEFLRYPDGRVADLSKEVLAERIGAIFAEERPDVVITFGPEGITAHPDHVAVGLATTAAFHRLRVDGGAGFERLLHNAIRRSDLDRLSEELVRRGLDPIDQTALYQPHGVDDRVVNVAIDCRRVWERKRAALREHRTQAGDVEWLPEDLGETVFGTETFAQAWPARDDREQSLADLFEDL